MYFLCINGKLALALKIDKAKSSNHSKRLHFVSDSSLVIPWIPFVSVDKLEKHYFWTQKNNDQGQYEPNESCQPEILSKSVGPRVLCQIIKGELQSQELVYDFGSFSSLKLLNSSCTDGRHMQEIEIGTYLIGSGSGSDSDNKIKFRYDSLEKGLSFVSAQAYVSDKIYEGYHKDSNDVKNVNEEKPSKNQKLNHCNGIEIDDDYSDDDCIEDDDCSNPRLAKENMDLESIQCITSLQTHVDRANRCLDNAKRSLLFETRNLHPSDSQKDRITLEQMNTIILIPITQDQVDLLGSLKDDVHFFQREYDSKLRELERKHEELYWNYGTNAADHLKNYDNAINGMVSKALQDLKK